VVGGVCAQSNDAAPGKTLGLRAGHGVALFLPAISLEHQKFFQLSYEHRLFVLAQSKYRSYAGPAELLGGEK
jgi:hypothetical protein